MNTITVRAANPREMRELEVYLKQCLTRSTIQPLPGVGVMVTGPDSDLVFAKLAEPGW